MARGGYGGSGLPLHARHRGDTPTSASEPAAPPWEGPPETEPGRPGTAEVDPCPARHCWVAGPADGGGPRPGLLLEWRRRAGEQWEGRVIYPAELRPGAWATVEEWLPARSLTALV